MNRGPLAVVFSSGFFGFFAHAGFLSALGELRIRPTSFGGSSSGAIVGAMAACGMGDDAIRETLLNLRRADFWDPEPWPVLLRNAFRLFKGYTGYLRGEGFKRLLRVLPVETFEELRWPLVVAATDLSRKRGAFFAGGPLIPAIHASGAVPGLFKAVEIEGAYYVDGGITCKAPVLATADVAPPRRMLIHYLDSQNLEEGLNRFLMRRMTPWHIHLLAGNIARREAYALEVRMARMRGMEVTEVRTKGPLLGPNRLEEGMSAYLSAKNQTLEILSRAGWCKV